MSRSIPDRSGLSLLEVMIATGILAGSAIVLSSIIGTGARFGNRAESRITALVQGHSLLDECLARIATGNLPEEITGDIPGPTPRSFQIVIRKLQGQEQPQRSQVRSAQQGNTSGSRESELDGELVQVEVLLFDSESQSDNRSTKPILHLSQITRRGPVP